MWISQRLLLLFWPMWHLTTNFKILTENAKIKTHFKGISLKYKININNLFDTYKSIQNITHFMAKFTSSLLWPEIFLCSDLLQMKLLSTYFEYQFSFTIWVANSEKFLALCYKWGRKLVTHKPQRISHIGFLPESVTFQRSKQSNFLLLLSLFLIPSIMASRRHFNLEDGYIFPTGKERICCSCIQNCIPICL